MTRSTLRAASAALAVAATLLVAGCTADADTDPGDAPNETEPAVQEEVDPDAPVEVPDVTNLILSTAQDTIEAKGLTVEIVDESGAGVTVDDPTTYTVADQDPVEGTVDPGSLVTLTVEPRG